MLRQQQLLLQQGANNNQVAQFSIYDSIGDVEQTNSPAALQQHSQLSLPEQQQQGQAQQQQQLQGQAIVPPPVHNDANPGQDSEGNIDMSWLMRMKTRE